MQLAPQQALVEKHIEGLNFKIQDKMKKTSSVSLKKPFEDYKTILALAHYSLRLTSNFVFESCFAFVIVDHFKHKGNSEPLTMADLYEKGTKLADIFRSEHILLDHLDEQIYRQRMRILSTSGIFVVKDDKISLRENKPVPVLDLFSKMCQVFFDTYFIVLTMLD